MEKEATTRITRDVHFDPVGVIKSEKVLSTVINGDSWESYDLVEACDVPGIRRFVNRMKLKRKNKRQRKLGNGGHGCRGCKRRQCILQRKQPGDL